MKKIGLLGGVSWVSTLDYYRYINEGINERLGGLRCVVRQRHQPSMVPQHTTTPRRVDETEAWQIAGIRTTEEFFREIPTLLPEDTVMYLEGSPHPEILEILSPYLSDQAYGAPIGTLWSLPRSRRYCVRAAPELFAGLSKAAAHHAAPEICDHLHFYRGDEPLANWFDAFHDPFLLTTAIPRDRVEHFCDALGVPFPHAAA